jgi:hypothetical protein
MRDHSVSSEILGGDYRVTRTAYGLRIEVLDYHAGPLHLGRADLVRLGLIRADSAQRRVEPTEKDGER